MPMWWNGLHKGLKIPTLQRAMSSNLIIGTSKQGHSSVVATSGFDPVVEGSIPSAPSSNLAKWFLN
jgi:hypothetical protein